MLIERLKLKKILSFNDATIKLGQLNVLIGPNAVGKTNLIESRPPDMGSARSRPITYWRVGLRFGVHSGSSLNYPLVLGKPVQVRHSPATVSAEGPRKCHCSGNGMGRPRAPWMRKSGDRPA